MKDQLQTLREAVNELHNSFPEKERALTALAQLEAMVGKQEPVAWITKESIRRLHQGGNDSRSLKEQP